jgi:hypothetical protein
MRALIAKKSYFFLLQVQEAFLFTKAFTAALGVYPAFYSVGTSGCFVGGVEADGAVKLTTHFNLVLRLRMHGVIPPISHIASWCGA